MHRWSARTAAVLAAAGVSLALAQHGVPASAEGDGLLADFVWRSIGPGGASGRIVGVESLEAWDGRFDPPAGYTPPPAPAEESAFLAAFRSPAGAPAGPGVYLLVLTTAAGPVAGVLRIREDPVVNVPR